MWPRHGPSPSRVNRCHRLRTGTDGPLQSFLVHGSTWAVDDGCPPLLVSPGPGFARPSSFTSLRQAPIVHGLAPGWRAPANSERCIGSGRRGVLRSEVKEEARSETGPGDTSAAERPVVLIARRHSRAAEPARANDRNGPQAEVVPA